MVDFNKPFQTIDGDSASLIATLAGGDYKFVIAVTAGGEDPKVYQADEDGDTEDTSGFFQNLPEETEEVALDASGTFTLPLLPAFRVVHTTRGAGTVRKVRNDPKKPYGIKLDSGPVEGDGGFLWALIKNVKAA